MTQPEELLARPEAEHWAGRLYMRRLSPYVTRLLVETPLSPNTITLLMIPAGFLTALSLGFEGLWPAIGAVLLAQLQLLLDCCDGEVARWKQRFSSSGIYLDQIAHYSTEAVLPAALGIRADGGWDSIGGWTALGLLVSVLILMLKSETHLLEVARGRTGARSDEEAPAAAPEPSGRLRLRQGVRLLPFFRPFHAVEATLLALGASVVDSLAGDLVGSRTLVLGLVAAAAVAVSANLLAILTSDRLR